MTQFSSVHIQSLIDERKARKSEMTGDLEESKFGSNYMIWFDSTMRWVKFK